MSHQASELVALMQAVKKTPPLDPPDFVDLALDLALAVLVNNTGGDEWKYPVEVASKLLEMVPEPELPDSGSLVD